MTVLSGERSGATAVALQAPDQPSGRRSWSAPRYRWEKAYRRTLLLVDAGAVAVAGTAGALVPGASTPALGPLSYLVLSLVTVPVWLAMLAAGRAYEGRFLGAGSDELRRVFDACLRLVAIVALLAFCFELDLSRAYVGTTLLVAVSLLLVGRYSSRAVLHRLRARGRFLHRVVLVGSREQVLDLARQFRANPFAGFDVVGACTPEGDERLLVGDGTDPLPVLGSVFGVSDVVATHEADTVAVASSPQMGPAALRRVAWDLEGTGVDVLVAPGLTDVAGTRIHVRPVAGLPLLHVEEPELTGGRHVLKSVVDRVLATGALVLLLPVLVVVALSVALSSRGGAFFGQERVGRGGTSFTVWKFRSMRHDAEQLLDTVAAGNEHDGLLFKMRRDPRVTAVGRWIRRFSLDELPQLWNVVRGEMSLVGPRPPLPSEVDQYGPDVRRRLLLKPGLTGLWQVSGRADLSWEDSVRLDLYYVENWSLTLDLSILARTASAVLRGRGAY